MRSSDIDLKSPLITIVTVVFNSASTIENTFNSVFNQDFCDFEYIVVDGGSTDGTVEIIKKYESRMACWISEPDGGVYDAMNKAVCLAKGKWLYFLGADDLLYNVLKEVSGYLIDDKTIYYGDVDRPFAKRRYDGEFSALKLSFRNICHQSIFYPRYAFKRYSYNVKYPFLADYDLNMQCYADPELIFFYIPITIAVFNDRGGLSQSKDDVSFQADKIALVKKNFPRYIYLIGILRLFMVGVLSFLKVGKVAVSMHHFYLRVLRMLTESSDRKKRQ